MESKPQTNSDVESNNGYFDDDISVAESLIQPQGKDQLTKNQKKKQQKKMSKLKKELIADVNFNPNDLKLLDEIKAHCQTESRLKDFDGNHPPTFPKKEMEDLKRLENYKELKAKDKGLYQG